MAMVLDEECLGSTYSSRRGAPSPDTTAGVVSFGGELGASTLPDIVRGGNASLEDGGA